MRNKMVKTETVKGFKDFLGIDAKKRTKILDIIRKNFEIFGFEPAQTPIIEYEEFSRGNNENDSAVRDTFKLKDRGKRDLALRYEFTFQLKRIAKKQKLPYKRYQIGPIFRDEPIRQGRLREFIQADADIIGSTLKDEAENFKLIKNIFNELQIPIKIYVNNRQLINEILVDQNIEEKYWTSVIREIDKLDKLSKADVAKNLKEYNAEKILKIFNGNEESFEKYGSYKEIKELKEYARLFDVRLEFRPFLARGFSYYNKTVFEVWSEKLNVSILGGGSYLVDNVQSTGISFGLEPISLLTNVCGDNIDYLIVSLGQDKEAINLTEKLRKKGCSAQLMMDKTLGKSIEYANIKQIKNLIIVGEEEVNTNKYKVKNLKTGEETKLDNE
jgi:histidyl-tRNA synthetase